MSALRTGMTDEELDTWWDAQAGNPDRKALLHDLLEEQAANDALDRPLGQFVRPFVWRDPATMPRREWLYGRHLIRKFVSATFAPGGVGKSALALAEAMAMASGKPLLGPRPRGRLRVGYRPRRPMKSALLSLI